MLWVPALLELQSIVTVIATLVIIAATVAQSIYLHKPIVAMIVVSALFVGTFVINLAVHVHRKRDQVCAAPLVPRCHCSYILHPSRAIALLLELLHFH